MKVFPASVALAAAVAVLAACGFEPLYGGGRKGAMSAEMATVRIDPINDRTGQQLRNHLLDLMNPTGQPAEPRYRLKVTLSESAGELAVRKSEIATRANLVISASFALREAESSSPVFSGTSAVTGSYNVLSSDFSTLISEQDARARVVRELAADVQARLAAYFRLRDTGAYKKAEKP